MVRVVIANSSQETGNLLITMLKKRQVYDVQAHAIVCYGSPVKVKPNLNGNCGTDKVERMIRMTQAGVRTVPWFLGNKLPKDMKFPLLARKSHGFGGTDIMPVFQPQEVPWRVKAGFDWFSSYVPVAKEFRVWVFRGEHLDTYEKKMKRPEDFKFVAGRNYRQGFEFELSQLDKEAFNLASRATDVLKFDFAAVDMILGEDGNHYLLEANTAPGVLLSHAEDTLGKLADKIVKWDQSGHKD